MNLKKVIADQLTPSEKLFAIYYSHPDSWARSEIFTLQNSFDPATLYLAVLFNMKVVVEITVTIRSEELDQHGELELEE